MRERERDRGVGERYDDGETKWSGIVICNCYLPKIACTEQKCNCYSKIKWIREEKWKEKDRTNDTIKVAKETWWK